jgi:hypothetical protein
MSQESAAEQVQDKKAPPVHINFFKPHSPFAKENMIFTLALVGLWAVAVFGFQFLLIALQKPTPEPAHQAYAQVWGAVEAGEATTDQRKTFSRAVLSVLGKNVAVTAEHKSVLSAALSATVLGLLNDGDEAEFTASLAAENKTEALRLAAGAIGLEDKGFDKIMRELLPKSLMPSASAELGVDVKRKIPAIMDRYLIHNRSTLTDFTFIGFPFHYWYTSQFLLILFVLLCLVYATKITRIMVKHGRIKKEEGKA